MAGKNYDDDDIVSDINLTPFIDIMLVLLIIFMVSTSVAVDTGLKINLPKSISKTSNLDQDSIIIGLDKDAQVTISGNKSTMDSLEDDLKAEILKEKKGVVILRGDKAAKLEQIIKIMDISKKSGATKFALAIEQD